MENSSKVLTEQTTFEYSEKDIVRANGKLFLKGIIQKADTRNQNGRIYPRRVLERAVQDYQKLVEERRSTGELNHPSDSSSIDLERVCHVITNLSMEGNVVYGTLEILDTLPCGNITKALVEAGIKIGISSRGLGTVEKQGEDLIVQDFQIICWDIVSDPSTPGAWLSKMNEARQNQKLLSESKIYEEVSKGHLKQSDRINSVVNDLLSIGKK